MTLACLDISSKKRCLQRLFTYHLKTHTISKKVVSKVFAQKKGGESYDSYKYVFKFRWFLVASSLKIETPYLTTNGWYCHQVYEGHWEHLGGGGGGLQYRAFINDVKFWQAPPTLASNSSSSILWRKNS